MEEGTLCRERPRGGHGRTPTPQATAWLGRILNVYDYEYIYTVDIGSAALSAFLTQILKELKKMITPKERGKLAVEALKKEYPDAICSLVYTDPLQLLIATRLAAQCTDARVNMVTPTLFERFKTAREFADADVEDVEELIKSCGLYKTKARDIVKMAGQICESFNGVVPDNIDDLITLAGIGRKTANLVVGDIYKKPAVVVDTHCIRITQRLGFHDIKDAKKIEFILKDALDPKESNDFCHRLVLHGRAVCKARKPECQSCCMKEFCCYNLK